MQRGLEGSQPEIQFWKRQIWKRQLDIFQNEVIILEDTFIDNYYCMKGNWMVEQKNHDTVELPISRQGDGFWTDRFSPHVKKADFTQLREMHPDSKREGHRREAQLRNQHK